MTLNELERKIKSLKAKGVDGNTSLVLADKQINQTLASDIVGIQEEEISYSSSLSQFIVNTSGVSKDTCNKSIVIFSN